MIFLKDIYDIYNSRQIVVELKKCKKRLKENI
jgi:hypothetical protein